MNKLRTILLGILAAAVAGFLGLQSNFTRGAGTASASGWQGEGHGHGQGQGRGHGKGKRDNGEENENGHGGHRFRTEDRRLIREYFAGQWGNLPPGLAKRGGNLPPGLQKQLVRNGQLPPGLQKRLLPFPEELEQRLPPLEPDYQRGFIGASIVIYNRKTGLIADIVSDVIQLTK